ncbi:MAG: hypothetical protein U0457_14100 [Candidatus Sericytochromatia bacterium]
MSGVGFNNHSLLAQSYDKNKDGFVNELQISDNLKNKIDSNKDGKVSTTELASALKKDSVQIVNSQIIEGSPIKVDTGALNDLKNINTISTGFVYSVKDKDISDLKGTARLDAIIDNNRQYAHAIKEMDRGLTSIYNISRQNNNSITRAVNSTSDNALKTTRNLEFMNLINDLVDQKPNVSDISIKKDPFSNGSNNINDDPFNKNTPLELYIDTTPLENRREQLKTTYNLLKSAMGTINEQTTNLPDVKQSVKGVDNSISNAFSSINEIKSSKDSPKEVKKKLYTLADMESGQVKGRAKNYGEVGAGIGLVAGGVTGYLLGKNAKSAAIGAGAGLAVIGAASALIGRSIDNKHKQASSELKVLGDNVEKYNVDSDEEALKGHTQNTYNKIIEASNNQTIDNAIVKTKELNDIKKQLSGVEQRTANIAKGYKIAQTGKK